MAGDLAPELNEMHKKFVKSSRRYLEYPVENNPTGQILIINFKRLVELPKKTALNTFKYVLTDFFVT